MKSHRRANRTGSQQNLTLGRALAIQGEAYLETVRAGIDGQVIVVMLRNAGGGVSGVLVSGFGKRAGDPKRSAMVGAVKEEKGGLLGMLVELVSEVL